MNMWENCWNWMMSFWFGMLVSTTLLIALIALVDVLILRISGGERHR